LGHHSNRIDSIFGELDSEEVGYEIFSARQIGELIKIASRLSLVPDLEVPKGSIIRCTKKFFDGNLCSFVRFFGLGKGTTYSLWRSKRRVAPLELLLRIGFRTGTNLLDLLTKEDSLDSFNPLSTLTLLSKRLSPRLKRATVLKELRAAIEENPPPSFKEVVERLGYKSAQSLRSINAQLCDQIKANFHQHTQGKLKRKFNTARIQNDEVINSALESALNESSPPSLEEIARQLGYRSAMSLRARAPRLYKALVEKKRDLQSRRRAQSEIELEQALSSDPPISLNAVAKKLGYKTDGTLYDMHPELCRKIRNRYAKYTKTQFMLGVKLELESILVESPPPLLTDACGRIGVSDGFLRTNFPIERRLISARSLERRRNQSERNKENDRSKVRDIVQDLIKSGVFPSMNAVLDIYPANYLRRPEVWSIVIQVREELGFRV
jgi:DNA-binding MarR family transcriptional regulator